LALLSVAAFSATAHATPLTTDDVANLCNVQAQPAQDICNAYIAGVEDATDLARAVKGKDSCIPDGVTVPQMVKIFVKYTDNHPEQLHQPAAIGITLALADAFPGCK